MKEKPKIFLSYAHEDRSRVEKVYDSLRAEGFNPWMDTRDIRAGDKWSNVILKSLRESDFIIIFVSKNSVSKRGFIQAEIRSALNVFSEIPSGQIFLIPIRLDDSNVPTNLSHIHYVDLFEKGGWKKLVHSLKIGQKQRIELIGEVQHLQDEIKKDTKKKEFKEDKHIFVAMPFSVEMEDIYHYGIMPAVKANDFQCVRLDKTVFTGDILEQIKKGIQTCIAVIAELSGFNPNVHVELGYSWGMEKPTILLLRDGEKLCFDVRGQRCLTYHSIMSLEKILKHELEKLKAEKII